MSLYEIPVQTNKGVETSLAEYQDKVVVVVNVASKCGLTPQYEGLEKLYEQYKDRGLVIVAFPANNFLGQEPGSDDEIRDFCTLKYNVSFPLYKKINIVGEDKHPLYKALIEAQPVAERRDEMVQRLTGFGIPVNPEPEVAWNFEKFIIAPNAKQVLRFGPSVTPDDAAFVKAIEDALPQ